jgi:hypothetical protein
MRWASSSAMVTELIQGGRRPARPHAISTSSPSITWSTRRIVPSAPLRTPAKATRARTRVPTLARASVRGKGCLSHGSPSDSALTAGGSQQGPAWT